MRELCDDCLVSYMAICVLIPSSTNDNDMHLIDKPLFVGPRPPTMPNNNPIVPHIMNQ